MVYTLSEGHGPPLTSPVVGLHRIRYTSVVVIQDDSGYPLYVDGGASGWGDVIPFSNATPDVKDCITCGLPWR
jgi:hypothetical protein